MVKLPVFVVIQVVSENSPNTRRMASATSPKVAHASTAAIILGINLLAQRPPSP
ncbi:MAG TPA: hypothetical protein VFY40_04950 [Blastocatellia bacterium]|nr:hypothetical protein [Blastocatellia bacterium]